MIKHKTNKQKYQIANMSKSRISSLAGERVYQLRAADANLCFTQHRLLLSMVKTAANTLLFSHNSYFSELRGADYHFDCCHRSC